MCSRYFVDLSPELRPFIEEARSSRLADRMIHRFGRPVIQEGEVKPTDIAPVIAPNARGIRSAFPMIWGFSQAEREHTKRMQPLILPESLIAAWVDPSTSAADVNKIASSALTDMIMERV